MTLTELVTTATDWMLARNIGNSIRQDLATVRREYLGKAAVEVMPTGARVNCKIIAIDWCDSLGISGGWSVRVEYLNGLLEGMQSETSDTVLEFGSK